MAETFYQVRVRDTDGATIAVFVGAGRGGTGGGMQAFSYRKRLRTPGSWWVQIDGNDERIATLQLDDGLDYIFEFWRRDPIVGLGWYRDFSGLHRYDDSKRVAEGREIFTFRGRGLNDLLGAEPIRYDKGTAEAAKTGAAETVAKEYIDENIGPGAPNPLDDFTVEADAGTGNTWGGDRANKQLFDVLVELADFAPGDFNIVDLSATSLDVVAGTPEFQFQWRENQWGPDKTSTNTDGNVPVVFGVQRRNATNINYVYSRLDEVNVVYVVGQGAGATKRARTRTATDAGLDSTWDTTKWGRRAVVRTTQDYSDSDMDDAGDETLYKQRARTSFNFQTNMSINTRYGYHWDYGDLVTVEYRGQSTDQKIVGVIVSIASDGGTSIVPETEDWYG